MTARQQIARLLPLGLLVLLVIAGLRGAVAAPGWNGPLRAYGTVIGIGLEVLCGALLIVIRVRATAARREAGRRPYSAEVRDIEPAAALRYTLSYVLGPCMIAIAVVLVANLHLHFFASPTGQSPSPLSKPKPPLRSSGPGGGGFTFHIPLGPILYGLLVVVLVAAVAVSIWWAARLHRPAVPLVIEDVSTEELREAVAEGRAALAGIDDARAAIIACYVAMERSLAERGTARAAADTPDELLTRSAAASVTPRAPRSTSSPLNCRRGAARRPARRPRRRRPGRRARGRVAPGRRRGREAAGYERNRHQAHGSGRRPLAVGGP